MNYSYEITPRPIDLGGGWRLRLLENGQEVGGGVFITCPDEGPTEESLREAYADAESEAQAWMDSRSGHVDESDD